MARTKAPAFQFYANDFLIGVVSMPLLERGAYITLLAIQWSTGSVPGDDMAAIGRMLGVSKPKATTIWKSLIDKFNRDADGLWRNERMEEERRKQEEYRQLQSDKGKARLRLAPTEPVAETQPPLAEASHQPKSNSSSSSSSSSSRTTAAKPLTAKRNLNAEFEHPRFDVPTSWHLRHVKDLSDGEAGMLNFYAWLAARVDRTNEDTIAPGVEHGRFVWLDRCFTEWSASRRTASPSDALVEATKRRQAELEAKHDPRFDGLTLREKFALAKELREAEAS